MAKGKNEGRSWKFQLCQVFPGRSDCLDILFPCLKWVNIRQFYSTSLFWSFIYFKSSGAKQRADARNFFSTSVLFAEFWEDNSQSCLVPVVPSLGDNRKVLSINLYMHYCTNKSYYCDDRHSSVIAQPVEIPSNVTYHHGKIVLGQQHCTAGPCWHGLVALKIPIKIPQIPQLNGTCLP